MKNNCTARARAGAIFAEYLFSKLQSQGWESVYSSTATVYKRREEGKTAYLGMYVDDGGMTGHPRLVVQLVIELKDEIEMDQEPEVIQKLLGVEYSHLIMRQSRGLLLGQVDYARYTLGKFTEENEGPPREAKTPSIKPAPGLEKQKPGRFHASSRKHIGGLIFLMKNSRPDICCAVGLVSTDCESWSKASDAKLSRIFGYLRRHGDLVLLWVAQKHHAASDYLLRTQSGSDHAGGPKTRRSRSGWIAFISTRDETSMMLIDWASKRQGATARSSTEAEVTAVNDCTTRTGFWMLTCLTLESEPVWIHAMDSDAGRLAIMDKKPTVLSYLGKHQGVQVGFLRDTFDPRKFPRRELVRRAGTNNEADIFTKEVDEVTFWRHVNNLGMVRFQDYEQFIVSPPILDFTDRRPSRAGNVTATAMSAMGTAAKFTVRVVGTAAATALGDAQIRQYLIEKILRRI